MPKKPTSSNGSSRRGAAATSCALRIRRPLLARVRAFRRHLIVEYDLELSMNATLNRLIAAGLDIDPLTLAGKIRVD